MSEEIRQYQVNRRYRVQFKRGTQVAKGIIGYEVEANGDSLDETFKDAEKLKANAELVAGELALPDSGVTK